MNRVGELVQKEISMIDSVIEMGCGIMQATLDTCPSYPKTKLQCARYVGVDVFKEYVDFLNKRDDVSAVLWDLTKTPYPFTDKSFDVVLLIDILEHLPDLKCADTLILEAIRIGAKKVIAYTPEHFCDNLKNAEVSPFPYDKFNNNPYQEHRILITKDWLEHRGFKVQRFSIDSGALYAILNLQPKKPFQLFKGRHRHETEREYWDIKAKLNPYDAVCQGARSESDFSQIRYSLLFLSKIAYKDKVLLDLCCGLGRIASFVSKDVDQYIGVDWSSKMITLAQERFTGKPNVRFMLNDGVSLKDVYSNSIDIVVCELAFQHMEQHTVRGYIAMAYRVLRPNGVFLAQIPRASYYDKYSEYAGRGFLENDVDSLFCQFEKVKRLKGSDAYINVMAVK